MEIISRAWNCVIQCTHLCDQGIPGRTRRTISPPTTCEAILRGRVMSCDMTPANETESSAVAKLCSVFIYLFACICMALLRGIIELRYHGPRERESWEP